MNAIYERFFEGSTLFARSVGLAFSETLCSKAVRVPKGPGEAAAEGAALAAGRLDASPVRVLSIGAGPAQELHELFQEVDELPVAARGGALRAGQERAGPRLPPAHARRSRPASRAGSASLFLHDSIKRLLRDGSLFAPFGKFDLVYSAGLLDYLQHRTGIVLTRHLASAAAPGRPAARRQHGRPRLARLLLQVHLDWPLIYRTREELLEVGAPGGARRAGPHPRGGERGQPVLRARPRVDDQDRRRDREELGRVAARAKPSRPAGRR